MPRLRIGVLVIGVSVFFAVACRASPTETSAPVDHGGTVRPVAVPEREPERSDEPLQIIWSDDGGRPGWAEPPPDFPTEGVAAALTAHIGDASDEDEIDGENLGLESFIPIDDSLHLARSQWGAVESVIFVVDATGTVHASLPFTERAPRFGVVDLVGDERKEVVVEVIEGNELSSYPRVWRVFVIGGTGGPKLLAQVPVRYSYGSKCEKSYFINEVVLRRDRITVENVYWQGQGPHSPTGAPDHAGQHVELRFDGALGVAEVALPDGPASHEPEPCSDRARPVLPGP